jgi:hypothetical protein
MPCKHLDTGAMSIAVDPCPLTKNAKRGPCNSPQAQPHLALWLNQSMFARKVRVEYEHRGQRVPCPLKWLDSFSMRNFTNASVFDNTLPVSDGRMEIGTNVPLDQLREAMEDWFRRKSYLPKDSKLLLEEI